MIPAKKLSRRNMLAIGAGLSLTPVLGACSTSNNGSANGSTNSSGNGSAQSRTHRGRIPVTFWSSLRGSTEVVQAFNESQDEIEVIFSQIPTGGQGGYAILRNAARAGNAPDVVTLEYPQLPGFVIDGIAQDLTTSIDPGFQASILPEALARTTYAEKIYAIPNDLEPMVLHYRSDIFERRGYTVPETWDEFAELAQEVRSERDGTWLANFATNGGAHFAAFAQQAGAQWFDTSANTWTVDMAGAQTQRIAHYWQDLIDRDLVSVMADGQGYSALLSDDKILARTTGAWDAGAQMSARPGQREQWRVAPLPQWNAGDTSLGDHGGSTFAITSDSDQPEAAMEFIRWQVSHPDSMRARLSAGTSSMFPIVDELIDVARDVFDDDYYGGQDIYTLFSDEAVKVRDDWNWGPRMTATLQVMQDNFARVQATDETIIDAIRAAQSGTIPDLRSLGLSIEEGAS